MSSARTSCVASGVCGAAAAPSGFGAVRATWPIPAIAAALRRLAGPWRRRGAIRELHRLSDRQLRDVGIARDEIDSVVDALLAAGRDRGKHRP